jgi:WD40 repeat protein
LEHATTTPGVEDILKYQTIPHQDSPNYNNFNNNNSQVYMGKWNPHLDGNQFTLISGQSVKGIDIRSMQRVWEFKSVHKFQVRDIDFNPNKQYYFATCGDDCATRFWDIRKPNECLKEVCEHSHW